MKHTCQSWCQTEQAQSGCILKQVHQNHSCLNSADRQGPYGGCCGVDLVWGHCLTIPMRGGAGLGQCWRGQLLQNPTASKSPVLAQAPYEPGGPVPAPRLVHQSLSNSTAPDSPSSHGSFGRPLSPDLPCSSLGDPYNWSRCPCMPCHTPSSPVQQPSLAAPSHAPSSKSWLCTLGILFIGVYSCCYAMSERTAQKTSKANKEQRFVSRRKFCISKALL